MNPGAVNAMAEEIIASYEQPDAICYWEYDDDPALDGVLPGPSTTWSQGESGDEIIEDWTFEVIEEGTVLLHEDALELAPAEFRILRRARRGPEHSRRRRRLADRPRGVHLHGLAARHGRQVRLRLPPEEHGVDAGGRLRLAARICWCRTTGGPGRAATSSASPAATTTTTLGSATLLRIEQLARVPADTNATCLLVAAGIVASGLHLEKAKVKPGVYLTHELSGLDEGLSCPVAVHSYESNGDEVELDDGEPQEASGANGRWHGG